MGFSNMNNQVSEQQKVIEAMQKNKSENFGETFAYAVATADLKAGQMVSDTDVDFKQFDEKNPNAFENRSDVINKILLKDITSGDTFTTAQIAKISNDDVTLQDGYRALTLPADNFQGRSESMTQGTSVDIYSAAGDNSWVQENVKILSFEGAGDDKSKPATITTASAITFEVPADTISSFISNISKSKLVLVARGAGDKRIVHKKKRNNSSSANYGSKASLPNLPASVPISGFNGGSMSGLSGLPQPIQPTIQQPSVELIEANVKSKVTFDEKE